jgi:hypothetical protein
MEKWYLVKKIDSNGDETGDQKLIQGALNAASYLKPKADSEGKKSLINALNDMKVDDFKSFFIDRFDWEIDCLSHEDAISMTADSDDLITMKEVPVYELFGSDDVLEYAFGDGDLLRNLTDRGFTKKDAQDALNDLTKDDTAQIVTEDPVHLSIDISKLDEKEVSKLMSKDKKFALDLTTARNMLVEGAIEKDGTYLKESNGKFSVSVIREGKEVYRNSDIEDEGKARLIEQFINETEATHTAEVVFSDEVADDAADAIADSPFLFHNGSFVSKTSFMFSFADDDDKREINQEIVEQMEKFGIDPADYQFVG